MPITIDAHDAGEVIAESLAMIQPIANQHGIAIERGGDAVAVLADRRRLQQVILNLVSNAVRFSAAGTTIRIETEQGLDARRPADADPRGRSGPRNPRRTARPALRAVRPARRRCRP